MDFDQTYLETYEKRRADAVVNRIDLMAGPGAGAGAAAGPAAALSGAANVGKMLQGAMAPPTGEPQPQAGGTQPQGGWQSHPAYKALGEFLKKPLQEQLTALKDRGIQGALSAGGYELPEPIKASLQVFQNPTVVSALELAHGGVPTPGVPSNAAVHMTADAIEAIATQRQKLAAFAPPAAVQMYDAIIDRMLGRTPQGGEQAAQPQQPEGPGLLSRIGGGLMRGAKDVGYGVGVEAVPQAIEGRLDAIKNMFGAVGDLGDWINEHAPDWMVSQEAVAAEKLRQSTLPRKQLGIFSEPTTTTGAGIRKISEFLTGYNPAMSGLGAMGVTGFAAAPVAGAVSSLLTQDPNAQGLSNLIQSFPKLQNPVTEFLASDPNDPAVVNRLRHAVESAGMGVLTEGITRGVRAFAAHRAARTAATQAAPEQVSAATQAAQQRLDQSKQLTAAAMPPEQMQAPLVKAIKTTTPLDAATDPGVPGTVLGKAVTEADHAVAKVAPDVGFNVNFARMGGEDFDNVVSQMATHYKGAINEARRNSITLTAQQALADQIGLTPESLLQRPIGQAYNAEKLIAAGNLFKSSRAELSRLAQLVQAPGATMVDEFALRRQFILHQALSETFLGARAEAGRALGALRVALKGDPMQQAEAIQQFWMAGGGTESAKQLAAMVIDLNRQGVADGAFNAAVRKGWQATGWDMVKEAYTLGLLWRPTTHIRNITGNIAMLGQTVWDTSVANRIGKLLGTHVDDAIVDGEASAMMDGMTQSIKDAFRLAWRTLKTGEHASLFGGPSTVELPSHMHAISAQQVAGMRGMSAAQAQEFAESGFGKAIDFIGTMVRAPGNALSAADDWFKQVNYGGQIAASAHRQALREGLSGAAYATRRAELISNPDLLGEAVKMAAFDKALYATFHNRPGEIAQGLMALRNKAPPLTFVMPFVNTPANIFKVAMEHSPLAPLMKTWRADVAAGGAARDLALAKVATGAAALQMMFDWASQGTITGPGPKTQGEREALQRIGWQRSAVRVGGNKFFSISGLGQLAPSLAFVGAMDEIMRSKELDPDAFSRYEEIISQGVGAMAASTIDQSFMTGVAQLAGALEDGVRGQTSSIQSWVQRQIPSAMQAIPGMSLVTSTKPLWQPTPRDINGWWDAVLAQLPGFANSLPPSRDLWGREMAPQQLYGPVYNWAVPFRATEWLDNPVDNEMARLGIGVDRLQKSHTLDKVPINFRLYPQAYDYLVRLAGNELKPVGYNMGAMDYLNNIISGKHPMSSIYQALSDGPQGGKANFIKDTVRDYRTMAEQQLLYDAPQMFPDLAADVADKVKRFAALKNQLNVAPISVPAPIRVPIPQGGGGRPAPGSFTVPSEQ